MEKSPLSKEEFEQIKEQYPDVARELLELSDAIQAKTLQSKGQENFIEYVRHMWPDVIIGAHHERFAEKLEGVAKGEIKRLIVNMPPRHTKSEFASVFFPSWLLGLKQTPNTCLLYTSPSPRDGLLSRMPSSA